MEGSFVVKTLLWMYAIMENSKTYKTAMEVVGFINNIIKNSFLYNMIITDFNLFDKWRSSILGTIFAKLCSFAWHCIVKIVDAVKKASIYSFLVQGINGLYTIFNSRTIISYSIQALAIMLVAFGTNTLFHLVGMAYIIYISLYKIDRGIYSIAFLIPFVSSTYLILLVIGLLFSFVLNIRSICSVKIEPYFILFFLFLVLSVITSAFRADSLRTFMLYGSALLFSYILIHSIKSLDKLLVLFKVNIWAGVIQSIYAALQYRFGIAMGGTWVDVEAFGDITTRAMGTLGNPNVLAKYLVLTILMGIVVLLAEKVIYKKIIYACFSVIMGLGLVLTYSRGGWLALIFGIFLIAIIMDKRLLIVFAMGAAALMVLSPDIIIRRLASITNITDTSNAYRISIWIGTLDLIRSNWMTGTGLGLAAFSQVYQYFVYGSAMAVHSHNLILQIAAELGIFGLLTFLILIAAMIKWALLSAKKDGDKRMRYFIYPLIGAIGAHLLHGFVDYVWYDPRILFAFWMVFGMLVNIVVQSREVPCD